MRLRIWVGDRAIRLAVNLQAYGRRFPKILGPFDADTDEEQQRELWSEIRLETTTWKEVQ